MGAGAQTQNYHILMWDVLEFFVCVLWGSGMLDNACSILFIAPPSYKTYSPQAERFHLSS